VYLVDPRHQSWIDTGNGKVAFGVRLNLPFLIVLMLLGYNLYNGLTMILQNMQAQSFYSRLEKDGVTTEATITENRIEEGDPARFIIRYTFTTVDSAGNPIPVAHEVAVPKILYDSATQTKRVNVTYFPDDLSVSYLNDQSYIMPYSTLEVLFNFAPTFIIAAIWITILRRFHRLRRFGKVIYGKLVQHSIQTSPLGSFTKTQYELESPSGKTLKGVTTYRRKPADTRTVPQQGSYIAILYVDDKLHVAL
jgi:hypothetical protein